MIGFFAAYAAAGAVTAYINLAETKDVFAELNIPFKGGPALGACIAVAVCWPTILVEKIYRMVRMLGMAWPLIWWKLKQANPATVFVTALCTVLLAGLIWRTIIGA